MPFLLERRIDLKESPIKTERKTLHLPEDTVRALNKLAAKNGTDFSKEVRRAIDEYLDLETTAENIDMINGVIRQELSGQLKALGNRLAGLINRLTIISAAGYYANIAIIADLIDQDRYSSFEKIESAARKRALAFANQKIESLQGTNYLNHWSTPSVLLKYQHPYRDFHGGSSFLGCFI